MQVHDGKYVVSVAFENEVDARDFELGVMKRMGVTGTSTPLPEGMPLIPAELITGSLGGNSVSGAVTGSVLQIGNIGGSLQV